MINQDAKHKQFHRAYGLCLFLLAAVISSLACASSDAADDKSLLVFSAASLVDVLNETSEEFEREAGIELFFNFGGSQKLAIDIINGAPADVFISAGDEPMKTVSHLSSIKAQDVVNIASNKLVVAGKDNITDLVTVADLLSMSRVSLADPGLAPAGYYAKQSFMELGLWEDLYPLIIFGADVRMAMAYVEVGNADVAVVYKTDISASSGLVGYDIIPEDSYPQVVYPSVPLNRNNKQRYAAKYLKFLQSQYVVEAFSRHGFDSLND